MLLIKDKRKIVREDLKEARPRHGLRQQDVAEVLGRPQSFVAKVENGERKADFVDVMEYSGAVGLDPQVLIEKLTQT
jgi:transcriptional regulator with XRE-family HTH domain